MKDYINFFDLKGEEQEVSCSISEKVIKVEDCINVDQYGDAEYSFLHHFHYTLDEEGNVDDIIFDYTGWD